MHDLWLTGLSAGHVKRVPVHGMQGPLEKQRTKAFALPPAPGGSDAKDVVGKPLQNIRKTKSQKAARAEGDQLQDTLKDREKPGKLKGMPDG